MWKIKGIDYEYLSEEQRKQGHHKSDGTLVAMDYRMVVIMNKQNRFYREVSYSDVDLADIPVTNRTVVWEPDKSIAEVKLERISDVKSQAGSLLEETDWYVIREAEGGATAPAGVITDRAAIRSRSEVIEGEINALTAYDAVVSYVIAEA